MEGAVTKTASEGAAFLGLQRPPPGSASAHPPDPTRLRGWERVQTKTASNEEVFNYKQLNYKSFNT
jgi:hypothetical protein